jgi:SAM-dependent methyltransferase
VSDRVFREGERGLEFVGDFDGLYESESDPWEQSGQGGGPMAAYYKYSRSVLVDALDRHQVVNAIEIGCGHGHLTALLERSLSGRVLGIDVSAEAVRRASGLHPACSFTVGDITSPGFDVWSRRPFACVIWGQILWYVLHNVAVAVDNSLASINRGGLFVISQAFLRGEQRYGRDIADGFDGTLRLFGERFGDRLRLVEALYLDADRLAHCDGLLIFRKV